MKQIESTITFRWWNGKHEAKNIKSDHVDALNEHAYERIFTMLKEGYTSGELVEEINGISYAGWWEIKASH